MNRILPLLALAACAGASAPAARDAAAAPARPQEPTPEGIREPDARMLRMPDVSADSIVFVYAENLWIVARTGGEARKITSHPGREMRPKFSPDGRSIAFSAEYRGNVDVYTIPVAGGVPRRVTWHPGADIVQDWFPDGASILLQSRRASPSQRFGQLFRAAASGGLAEPLPLGVAEAGAPSPDGRSLVFQPILTAGRTWKRYRGGMADELWRFDLDDYASRPIAPSDASDQFPMWHGDQVYFLSDRAGKHNIWVCDLRTDAVRQVTHFDEYDVLWPSLGPDAIVFENGGRLHLLDLATEAVQPLRILVRDDMPQALPQRKSVARWIESASLSPSGKRALFGARGDVFSVPAKDGLVRNLTATSGVAERYPVWSPDGRWIAWWSDAGGDYELVLRAASGGEERTLTRLGPGFRYQPRWSPDSRRLAFCDNFGRLYLCRAEDGAVSEVDRDPVQEMRDFQWSPDSRWLAYRRTMPNQSTAIWIRDVERGENHQVTSGFSQDDSPSFDPGGKYLWIASFRTWRPDFGVPDGSFTYDGGQRLYAIALRKDVPSPLAPRSDEERAGAGEEMREQGENAPDEEQDAPDRGEGPGDAPRPDPAQEPGGAGGAAREPAEKEPEQGAKDGRKDGEPKPVEIDFDGIEQRIVALPVEAESYSRLTGVDGGLLYLRRGAAGARLLRWSLEERKEEEILADIRDFELSADGKKLLWLAERKAGIADAKPGQKKDGELRLDEMEATIDPRAEWAQMYREAWRIERDFFYDPGMHGVDWTAMGERYERLLPFVASRADLNFVIGELIGELCSSHAYVGGGDLPEVDRVPIGLLGCDFELDAASGRYRITRIYRGEPGVSEAPLAQPGVDARAGDFLLQVEGREVRAPLPPYAWFEGLAGKPTRIVIAASTDGADRRELLVEPIASESELRNMEWVRTRREYVAERTGGRVGYVYVPSTGVPGLNELVRQFLGQLDRQGFVIDERWNSGGMIPDRFVELLNRAPLNFWARREFEPWQTPAVVHDGPKVMLINEWSGSGGDAFPWYFRKTGAGVLVGKRTWGGLIGISGNPDLIDGGSVTAPTFSFWNTEGAWDVENAGVSPDVEVENTPTDLARGRDPQLERAIELVLEQLERHPPQPRVRPSPVRR